MGPSTQAHMYGGLEGNHLIGLGGLPTVVLGPGAGTGSAVVTGTDTGCTVTLTVGAGNTNNSIVFTINFNTAYSVIPHTVLTAGNANAAANNVRTWVNNVSTGSFSLNVTNPALKTGEVYVFKFITIG